MKVVRKIRRRSFLALPKHEKLGLGSSGNRLKELKKFLCPIQRHEWKKFLPTFGIFFLLTFIYDMLRIIKSSLVVAECQVGAEIIPFLKVWAVNPGALLFTALVIKLFRYFDREKTFYIMLSLFIGFYLVFMVAIYPYRESLQLVNFSMMLAQVLPQGAKGFISMVSHWPLSLFYVVTELWGSTLIAMLFWGFANEITDIEQASRFYPLLLLGANAAAICAGLISAYFADHSFNPALPFGTSAWEQSLMFYLSTAIIGGLIILALYYGMHRRGAVTELQIADIGGAEAARQLSLKESFACLARSKHLLYIALLVLSYNLVFNLSDVLWEDQLKIQYFDDAGSMARYKSHITTWTGSLSVFLSLFVSGHLLRRRGWKYAAYATPLTIGLTGLGFFGLLLFGQTSWLRDGILAYCSDPVQLTMLLGSVQVCFSRGFKYTLFDTSKEIAFIPLSTQEKRLGKAAIDGVGSRLGKSMGSFLVQILLLCCSSIAAATPYMAVVIVCMLAVWCFAVQGLSRSLSA